MQQVRLPKVDAAAEATVAPSPRLHWGWLVPRALGAIAVVVSGVVHLETYFGPYREIPTIGQLFIVNFVAATMIGVALLAPIEHRAGRWAGAAFAVTATAGIALTAGSFVMLMISERTSLFGFQEPGYDPEAITLSRQVEVAAVVLLGLSLIARFATKTPKHRW